MDVRRCECVCVFFFFLTSHPPHSSDFGACRLNWQKIHVSLLPLLNKNRRYLPPEICNHKYICGTKTVTVFGCQSNSDVLGK